ncbi:hypothetical protein FA95DRAFT_1559971 [Auriscalpium vulgare]|uniref:Uncharacterized protein n=1 Tax=Auriscalpium vulgare TaxID=40419 RepID=A0ACB8RSN8_9AGAM|nr:hypothetical protein FA95DRAFT_1559971 [Auriscalpium vulgare]
MVPFAELPGFINIAFPTADPRYKVIRTAEPASARSHECSPLSIAVSRPLHARTLPGPLILDTITTDGPAAPITARFLARPAEAHRCHETRGEHAADGVHKTSAGAPHCLLLGRPTPAIDDTVRHASQRVQSLDVGGQIAFEIKDWSVRTLARAKVRVHQMRQRRHRALYLFQFVIVK